MGSEIARKNHFVPQHYLRNFADAQGFVQRYRLLVSSEDARLWQKLQPANIAFRYDLYTFSGSGEDDDDLERWFCNAFETRSADVIERVVKEQRLFPEDWRALADFFALQFVRTPAFLQRSLPRWQEAEAESLQQSLSNLESYLKDLAENPETPRLKVDKADRDDSPYQFPMRVSKEAVDEKTAVIRVETVVGRARWRHSMRHLLRSTLRALYEHRWTILHAPAVTPWFTTDDPAIALNFNSTSNYFFGGGWRSTGSELLLPLSPKHCLYTVVGRPVPARGTEVDWLTAKRLRLLIARHSSREIYAHREDSEVPLLRKRWINPIAVRDEREQWAKWHREHGDAERDIFRNEPSGF